MTSVSELYPGNISGIVTNASQSFDNSSLEYCELLNVSRQEEGVEDENVLFNFVTYGVLLNVVGLFGFIGNLLSIYILRKPSMKSSINQLLISLAMCDLVLIVTSVALFGLPSIYMATGFLEYYYYWLQPMIAPFVYPVAMLSQTISVYLTLLVTLERFVAVCYPLKARSYCTYRRAKQYTIAVVAFALVYNCTRFLEVKVKHCQHNILQRPIYRVYPSDLRNEPLYVNLYIHWLYLLFMYFLPFGTLAFLNTRIYGQIRRANRERQRLSRLQKKEIGLATMLLCVVVVFFICNLLALVSNILEAFYSITIDYLVEVGNLMVTVNSSVNFVIYVIFGEKFKRTFFKMVLVRRIAFCTTGFGGRDSPEQTHEDSYISCNGDRNYSIRLHLHRINTSYTKSGRNKNSHHHSRNSHNTKVQRASSPGPCVYYPARESRGSWEHTSTSIF